jgi:hypothetical protein
MNYFVLLFVRTECVLEPMLNYLSETKLLQSVRLNASIRYYQCEPNAYEASRLIRAIADNVHLALVQFSANRVPLQARSHHLLQIEASALRHLTLQQLQCEDNPPWSELDVAAFASAVGALTLLQSLTLKQFPIPEMSASMICQLSSQKHLQKLSKFGYDLAFNATDADVANDQAIVNAVSVMLQAHVPLEVLELKKVTFLRLAWRA